MRPILWMVAILLAVGFLASEIRLPQSNQPTTSETPWRRTEKGWMRATWLAPAARVEQPALHPCVVGSLELLLSGLALVAIPIHSKASPAQKGATGSASAGSTSPDYS